MCGLRVLFYSIEHWSGTFAYLDPGRGRTSPQRKSTSSQLETTLFCREFSLSTGCGRKSLTRVMCARREALALNFRRHGEEVFALGQISKANT